MSKLEELIQEYCPNGVEYKKLGDIASVERGKRVVREQLSQESGYPVYQNSLTIMGYHTDTNYPANTTFIIGAGAAGEIGFSSVDFWAADDCFPILGHGVLLDRYIYHVCLWKKVYLASKVRKASIPRLSRDFIVNMEIPVPPLPVQEEIVRILDSFTELTAELQAELQARKKQYEYYFKHIFTMYDSPMVKLGDVGTVKMCKRIMKSQTSSDGEIPFYKIGTFGNEADAYISRDVYEEYIQKYSHPSKGDILISCSGTIGRTVVYDGEPAYFQDSNIVWLEHDGSKVTNEYLRYAYKTNPWIVSTGGTISRLYNDGILKAEIPLPTVEQQRQIVELLDKFDVICNDMQNGLPAEIAARQKQYEYYRDKLLTFQPLSWEKRKTSENSDG